MVKADIKLLNKLKELIEEGNYFIGVFDEWNPSIGLNNLDMSRLNAWVMMSGHIIKNLCDKNDIYWINFEKVYENCDFSYVGIAEMRGFTVISGIIKGLYKDYESGLLVNVRNLLRGEIFVDFLDMGEHLLNEGYKDAAAVIIGTVLEDTLREIASKEGINIKKDNGNLKTINSLNQDIYKKGIYNSYIQKNITSLADLRNNAAHGHYNEYSEKEVKVMLVSVQDFCSKHLS